MKRQHLDIDSSPQTKHPSCSIVQVFAYLHDITIGLTFISYS